MGTAAAAGHAGLCGGLRLHRLPAVQRPLQVWLREFRPARPCVPRNPQHAGRGLGVHLFALSLRVPAGAHRAGRARRPAHGGGAPAGRAAVAPHPRGGPAAGAPGGGAGVALALMETLADFGVASYFGIQTFTAGIYKAWLAMDQPHGRGPARHRAAGHGGAADVAGTPGPAPHAFCRAARPARGQCRSASRCCCVVCRAGLAMLVCALPIAVRFRAAGAVHAAPAGRRLGSVCPGPCSCSGRATASGSPACRRRWPPRWRWRWPLRSARARGCSRAAWCSSPAWAMRCRAR